MNHFVQKDTLSAVQVPNVWWLPAVQIVLILIFSVIVWLWVNWIAVSLFFVWLLTVWVLFLFSDFQLRKCGWSGSLCACVQELESVDSSKHALEQGNWVNMTTSNWFLLVFCQNCVDFVSRPVPFVTAKRFSCHQVEELLVKNSRRAKEPTFAF